MAVVARVGVLEEEEEVFQILNLIACVLISVAEKRDYSSINVKTKAVKQRKSQKT